MSLPAPNATHQARAEQPARIQCPLLPIDLEPLRADLGSVWFALPEVDLRVKISHRARIQDVWVRVRPIDADHLPSVNGIVVRSSECHALPRDRIPLWRN